jgi:hypothetical protein
VAHLCLMSHPAAMTRACFYALTFLAACSPEVEKRDDSVATPPAKSSAGSPVMAAAYPTDPAAVPYKQLGWDSETSRLLLDGKPFTGVTTDFYKTTGKLKARYEVKDGVYHGLVQEWYDNGQQTTKTSYVNGKHEGDNFYWNRDGTLQVHKVWKDNNLVSETPGPRPG